MGGQRAQLPRAGQRDVEQFVGGGNGIDPTESQRLFRRHDLAAERGDGRGAAHDGTADLDHRPASHNSSANGHRTARRDRGRAGRGRVLSGTGTHPTFDSGTEYVQFSPTEAHAALGVAIQANLPAMMAAMQHA